MQKKNQNDADVFRDASNKKINWSEIMKNNDIFTQFIFFKKIYISTDFTSTFWEREQKGHSNKKKLFLDTYNENK